MYKTYGKEVMVMFFLLYGIAHFLCVSSFALVLFWLELLTLEVFIILSPEILVNLFPFFNGVSFLFYRFLKSGVTNELKSLFY